MSKDTLRDKIAIALYGQRYKSIPDGIAILKVDNLMASVEEYAESRATQTAKAYGGCQLCYGKGYATYINGTTAYADFGDELGGDYSRRSDELEMRFCSCDRGKQLERLLNPTNSSLEHEGEPIE